jgi:uncharacterized protein YaiL (DUF2058 family)
MSESLKDQLLKLGLARPEQARPKTPKPPPRRGDKAAGGAKGKATGRGKKKTTAGGEISLDEAFRLRARAEQSEADRARAAKLAEQQRRQRVNEALQALVAEHALNDQAAELKRNFIYKGRIRSVLVTPEQLTALNAGELGLVFLRGRYFLVAADIAAQAKDLSVEHVPDLSGPDAGESDEGDHPVPDDLLW